MLFFRIPSFLAKPGVFFLAGMCCGAVAVGLSGFAKADVFPVLTAVSFYIQNEYVSRDLDMPRMERAAIEGYLKALQDPYTRYLDPAAHELVQMQVQGSVLGMGILCQRVDAGLLITHVQSGGPAAKVGIRVGDTITEIEGISMSSTYRFGDLSKFLERDTIRVLIQREGRIWPLVVSREKRKSMAVGVVRVRGDIGYIQLVSLEPLGVVREMSAALSQLTQAGCRAVVLDLRQNTGGLLRNAVRVAGFFLETGSVVTTVDRYGVETSIPVEKQVGAVSLPVVIVVDEKTASSAEILAAALRDHGAATVIGYPTYGKSAVQKLVTLPDGSALLYTTSRYVTPAGYDIYQRGIPIDTLLSKRLSEAEVVETAIRVAKTFVRRT